MNFARTILDSRAGDDRPIYVRTGWEMGGDWFPWGAQGIGNPEAFKAAFRNFATAFNAVSERFEIVWDVVGDKGDVEQFYPGDDVVDVVSQDFYWFTDWMGTDPVAAFNQHAYGHSYGLQWLENFADAHGKKTAYSEWGVPDGIDATAYIKLAEQWFEDPNHNTVYHTYWDSNSAYPGLLSDADDASAQAYRAAFSPPGGGGGTDTTGGGGGNDTTGGGGGNDTTGGGSPGDSLTGSEAAEVLGGSASAELISSLGGDDTVYAGDGDDTIIGGAGNDYIEGGAGADVFVHGRGDGPDSLGDFTPGTDRIEIRGYTQAEVAITTTTYADASGQLITFADNGHVWMPNVAADSTIDLVFG
jgi:hypothetical protein